MLVQQRWHDDLTALRKENGDLKQQLQELSDYLDDQVRSRGFRVLGLFSYQVYLKNV